MGLGDIRRLELWITYVRWFGVGFGVVSVVMQPTYPSAAIERSAWALLLILALGNLAIWGAIARIRTERDINRLGAWTFAFDALILMSIVWVFAFDKPYITWAVLFVLPLEGAVRYRMPGALGAAAVIALFFIPQTMRVAHLHSADFDLTTYVFVVGISTLMAGAAGTMAENWHRQRVAFQLQSLRLSEVDRLKDRFLAVTSHEIRGPLTAIIAGVDTVLRRGDRLHPEQRSNLLEMVSTQGHQLARLVDDLLLTSELQERQVALHPEWTDLSAIIHQAVEAAASKRRSHQLEIYAEPMRCLIDAARVTQIIRNLVENAYKYTPDRTRVAVTAKGIPTGIAIEVDDDGDGIPSDHRDRLFEAFHRIEETSAGKDGVGLGLFVVSQLVAAMGGRIDLESSSVGTTFTIMIDCPTMALEGGHLEVVVEDQDEATG
jgi:signal transduction histidine kinase